MIMVGQMDMAKDVDSLSVLHGHMMTKQARKLYDETMTGKNMMTMHKEGHNPQQEAGMGFTHKLAEAILQVLDTLNKMPEVMKR